MGPWSWLAVVGLVAFVAQWLRSAVWNVPDIRGDVLLVFAHPDDEAMFFSPLLQYLRRRNTPVHFLCLSNGGFRGLGDVRQGELLESAAFFGIQRRNVKVVNDPALKDGMREKWDAEIVQRYVSEYIGRFGQISTVVTFDQFGISLHPNHVAVHDGVLKVKTSMPPGLIFLELKSRALISKYAGPFSLLYYLVTASRQQNLRRNCTVIIPPLSAHTSFGAMRRHASQLVWFRYLFVLFSSYTYLNELQEM